MRWFRIAINITLAILLLFDVVLGVQVYVHGWPREVTMTDLSPGVESVKVNRVPFTRADARILAALIGVHALLICLAWRLRRRRGRL